MNYLFIYLFIYSIIQLCKFFLFLAVALLLIFFLFFFRVPARDV